VLTGLKKSVNKVLRVLTAQSQPGVNKMSTGS